MRFTFTSILILISLGTCTSPSSSIDSYNNSISVIGWSDNQIHNFFADKSTPDIVSVDDLPEQDQYIIRTRIVIEYFTLTLLDKTMATMYGTTPEGVVVDLDKAEEIFSQLGLRFQITEVVFKEYKTGLDQFYFDALKYPDALSIYYVLPHAFSTQFSGLSSGPWEKLSHGIVITGGDNTTVAHEIGHYFGLLHTFSDEGNDYCDDTVPQSEHCKSECPDETPNCRNIMNYCNHFPKFATCQQIDRMRRFLRAARSDHIMKIDEQTKVRLEDMYNRIIQTTVPRYIPNEEPPANPDNKPSSTDN